MAAHAATAAHSLVLRQPDRPRAVHRGASHLRSIISGGQTGVDQAGLRAAVRLGLSTGGYAPAGFKTLAGPAPELGSRYGLVEHWSDDYAKRTTANVQTADATIRIAVDFGSAGERCTLKAIRKHKKPWVDIILTNSLTTINLWSTEIPGPRLPDDPAAFFRDFLVRHDVQILNVAGNSETTAPGVGGVAEDFLVAALGTSPLTDSSAGGCK